jgi:hypothetical protein
VYDRKAGNHVPYISGSGFIVPEWKIDHPARLQFTVKTLLGIGWKHFSGDFLTAVDLDLLRWVLTADFRSRTDRRERTTADVPKEGTLIYVDPFLVPPEQHEIHPLTKIESALIRKDQTAILIRELDGMLEWSVACLGYLVGSVRVCLHSPLIGGDVRPRGGIRLVVRRDRLQRELVGPNRIRLFETKSHDVEACASAGCEQRAKTGPVGRVPAIRACASGWHTRQLITHSPRRNPQRFGIGGAACTRRISLSTSSTSVAHSVRDRPVFRWTASHKSARLTVLPDIVRMILDQGDIFATAANKLRWDLKCPLRCT